MAVFWPVKTTMASALPFTTVVPWVMRSGLVDECGKEKWTNREYKIYHVLLHSFDVRNNIGCFADTLALSSKDCLVDAEITGRDGEQSAVRGDLVADGDEDYIAWYKLGGMDAESLASSKDFCFIGGILLKSLR